MALYRVTSADGRYSGVVKARSAARAVLAALCAGYVPEACGYYYGARRLGARGKLRTHRVNARRVKGWRRALLARLHERAETGIARFSGDALRLVTP